jgi:YVTN family beta-propeller protein
VGGFSGSVSVIDLRSNVVITKIPVGRVPRAIAFTPDGSLLYVIDQSGSVSAISTARKAIGASLTLDEHPGFLAIKDTAGE